MAIEHITMPKLGESVTEGTIERWFVQPGDYVQKYESLAEVTTDKVNAEIPSSFTGVVKELIALEGDTLPVGEIVCTIETDEEQITEQETIRHEQYESNSAPLTSAVFQKAQTFLHVEKDATSQKMRYSPAVLKLAQEHHIPLHEVTGTGQGGRITRKDLQKIIETGNPMQESTAFIKEADEINSMSSNIDNPLEKTSVTTSGLAGNMEIPVTSIRRKIAQNTLKSQQEIPHAWMMIEVDVTELVAFRNNIKEDFKRTEGFPLTYFAFFMKAVAQALKEFPILNSQWSGDKIILKKDIHISFAVATEDALFVPVIKHADEKSIKGLAKEIYELSNKARAGKLKLEDVVGGTFSLNNTGSFGSIQSKGIINHPQAAILQVESIVKKPVILNDNMFAARDMVNLCLSLDHRILDGYICGKFLQRVKNILEKTQYNKMSVY